MRYEEDHLIHYGIPGQKWGVRRFQNLDRTRTEEGKLRYRESLHKEFGRVEQSVRERSTVRYSPFVKRPINVESVKRRGNLNSREAMKCISIANRLFDAASTIEPRTTMDVLSSVVQSGSKMFGLENRLKQPESLASKIGQEATERNISFEEASHSIKDSIRYTAISSNSNFVKSYDRIKEKLKALGYTEIRCRNYFEQYREGKVQHKSVQSVFKDADGNLFELQFQTPSSQAAKEMKIPLYEERRASGVSEARKAELEMQMHDLAERVEDPKGIELIRSYG